jgi:hypothetical protein
MKKPTVFDVLQLLDKHHAWYELQRYCDDTIDINVTFTDLRLEISCHASGEIGYSVFRGEEAVFSDFGELAQLISDNGEL